jgi:hypothetical protein
MQLSLTRQLSQASSKANIIAIVRYVGNDSKRFNHLIYNLLQANQKLAPLAAWAISVCVTNHPELVKPHLLTLLKMVAKPNTHHAVKRNVMRLLQVVDIPKRYQGRVVNIGFRFLEPTEPTAVRAFSMTVLANIAKQQPALKHELVLIIEDQFPYGSAGFQSRAKKVLKELKK